MTPRLSIIGSAIRKLFGEVIGLFGDYYWNNVVTAMKMDTVGDGAWSKVVLGTHFDQPDPYWSSTVLAMHMDPVAYSNDPSWNLVNLRLLMDGADNGTTFSELTGKTVTVVGTVVTKTAVKKFGTASMYIAGTTGSYLNITPTAALQLTGDFTVECWVRPDNTAGNYVIFSFNTFSTAAGLRLSFYNGGLYLDIGAGSISNASAGMVGGTWYHVAVTRSGTSVKIFVNGSQVASGSNSTTFSGWDRYTIGAMLASGSSELNISGYIDDFRVTKDLARYTSNFTAPTDALPYYSNLITDTKGKTVTVSGNVSLSSTQSKYGGYSAYFDGTGDYVDIADSADFAFGTGDFTIEFWVWTDPTTAAWSRILENIYFNITGGWHFSYNGTDSAGSRRLGLQLGLNGGGGTRLESLAAIPTSQWVHIAVVRSSGVLGYFVDGKLQSSVNSSDNFTSQSLRIGATLSTPINFFKGYIDDLRITKGVARYPIQVASGDPHLANVVLGMHFDGANDGTVFTEYTGRTVTRYGNSVTKTAVKKFGSASLYLDGTGDYLTLPTSTDFLFTGDFTIEAWVYPTIAGNAFLGTTSSIYSFQYGGDNRFRFYSYYPGQTSWSVAPAGTHALNTWHHVVVSRQGSTVRMFINGVLEATTTYSANVGSNAYPLRIGTDTEVYMFAGYIDDLRITNGVARYTATFTPPASAFPETPGESAPSSDFTPLSYAFPDPVTKPIFDEKGKSFTLVGTPTLNTTTKKFGGASLSLNGTTDYLVVPLSADFGFGTGDFTIECWVNTSASSGAILDWRSDLANPCTFIAVSGGRLGVWNGDQLLTGSTTVNTGTWVHITVQRTKGVIQGFVNGLLDLSFDSESYDLGASRTLYIGATLQASTFLAGYLDDLRVTKGLARYAGNFTPNAYPFPGPLVPAFLEETGKTVTVGGGAQISTAQKKFGKASAKFDGSNDRVTLPVDASLNFGADDFTIECWIHRLGPTASGGTNPWMLVDGRTNGVNELYIAGNNSDNAVYIGHNSLVTSALSSTSIQVGQWYHIAVTRHSGTMFLFINGVLEGMYVYNGNVNLSGATIGGRYDFTSGDLRSFNGHIDDLRITKGVARYIYNPPSVSADPQWSSVVLGMPMDGTNGSTVFTDLKGKTVTVYNNAIISTAQSKFGGASAYFDGTEDYLKVPSSSDFDFGSDPFTIECWIYPTSLGVNRAIVMRGSADGNGASSATFMFGSSGSYLLGYVSAGGNFNVSLQSSSGVLVVNQWQHVAVVRVAVDLWRLFHNGVKVGEINGYANPVNASTGPIVIGMGSDYIYYSYSGYIDDLRITKGVARYSSDFTPATSTYLPSSSVYAPAFTPDTRTIQTYAGTPYDQHWGKVVLGLHMDGADNGTTFTEALGKTVTANGNAVTKTAVKKFGTASAYFDGTGDYLSVPSSSDFDFGSGDFTIECWVYVTSLAAYRTVWARAASGTSGCCLWGVISPDGTFSAYAATASASWDRGASSAPGAVTVNAWTHLAFTRSGANLRVFVNGVLSGTDGAMSTSSVASSTGAFLVGTYLDTTQYQMLGYIDDFRITKGLARYTANFQPDQFPFPEKSYDPPPLVGDKFRSNVVLGLHMDGADNGTVFPDITGKAVTANGNAVTKTAVKKFGTASAYFDGAGDYLSIPSSADFDFGSGDFTIEFWLNMASVSVTQGIIDKRQTLAARGFVIYFDTTGGNKFWFAAGDSNTSAWEAVITSGTIVSGRFYHLAFCRSGPTFRAFVDGVLAGTATWAGTIESSTSNLLIGATYGPSYPLNGYIDDLRITKGVARYTENFALPGRFPDHVNINTYDTYSPFVVLAMHMDGIDNGTSFPDLTGKVVSRVGDVVTKTAVKKFGTASAYFDGVSDYLTVPASTSLDFGIGDFTIEAWIYPQGNTGVIVARQDTNLALQLRISSGVVNAVMRSTSAGGVVNTLGGTVTVGEWSHVAVTRSSGTVRVFLNGVSGATQTFATALDSASAILAVGILGYDTTLPFAGYIDDLRITKGVARYVSDFTPPSAPFPAILNLSPTDTYRSYVVLGLHMDGVDNGTTFTELTGKTVTRNGDVVTKTAVKKFGTASAYFDGTGDYLTLPTSTDFSFGSGDFTIECWVNLDNTTGNKTIIQIFPTGSRSWDLLMAGSAPNFRATTGGVSDAVNVTGPAVTASTWNHIAAVRSGNTVTVYTNGVAGTPATFTGSIYVPTSGPNIGRNMDGVWFMQGYIDDLRITKGVARYTSDFTPPTIPFQDT